MQQDIQTFSEARQIKYLLHFTRLENLPSILQNGLVSRSYLDWGIYNGTTNDIGRFDNRRDYNCLSISFPNCLMFYKYMNENPEAEWPILLIRPQVLWNYDTLFCQTNAAATLISEKSEAELKTVQAFGSMFAEIEGHTSRADQLLKICDTTDVQAEVLVKGIIPPSEIYGVIFRTSACLEAHKAILGDRSAYLSSRRGMYGNRDFYRRWGNGK